jgi:tRNA-dihydrouridine synthase
LAKSERALKAELAGKFFLSSMMGITDGAWCAGRRAGCAMVQLGAYLAEPTATADEIGRHGDSFLPADPAEWAGVLGKECAAAKGTSDVVTCVNLATPQLEWAMGAGKALWEGGGEVLELNAHGGYGRYLEQGLLRAMVLPENQAKLFQWVEALSGLEIPLIVKVNGASPRPELLLVADGLAEMPIFGLHVNVRDAETGQPDLDLVSQVRDRYSGFLLVSGHVRSAADAAAVFEAGADMVGVAEPTIKDPAYMEKLAAG